MKNNFQAMMNGDISSTYNKNTNQYSYITNYGNIDVAKNTGKIEYACVGFGRNYKNTRMTIKIDGSQFQIIKTTPCGLGIAELNSPNYSYKHKDLMELDLGEVLEMLKNDDNFYYVAILVKKTLIHLMLDTLKFNRQEKQMLKEVFSAWRKPIITKRTPIITKK